MTKNNANYETRLRKLLSFSILSLILASLLTSCKGGGSGNSPGNSSSNGNSSNSNSPSASISSAFNNFTNGNICKVLNVLNFNGNIKLAINDGTNDHVGSVVSNGQSSCIDLSSLAEGVYSITYGILKDIDNDIIGNGSGTITIDKTAPTYTLSLPSNIGINNSLLTGSTIGINATDSVSGMASTYSCTMSAGSGQTCARSICDNAGNCVTTTSNSYNVSDKIIKELTVNSSASTVTDVQNDFTTTSIYHEYVTLGTDLYFVGYTSSGVEKLFKYNGTSVTQVSNTAGNGVSDNIGHLKAVGTNIYFAGNMPNGRSKLFKYDGTTVTQISNTSGNLYNDNPRITRFQGTTLYFKSNTTTSLYDKLYKYDGTTLTQISDIRSGNNDNILEIMPTTGNKVFFSATSMSNQTKLYMYNGSSVSMVTETRSGFNENPTNLTRTSAGLFYQSMDSSGYTRGYFTTDGVTVTPLPVVNAAGNDAPYGWVQNGTDFYFWNADASGNYKLHKYDSLASTTTQISNLNPAGSDTVSSNDEIVVANGEVYFLGNRSSAPTGSKLHKVVGNSVQIAGEGNPGVSESASNLVVNNNKLYFVALNSSSLYKIFEYDGTVTTQMPEVKTGLSDQISGLFSSDNKLYFRGRNTDNAYKQYVLLSN